ncbi:MAG: thioredoxin [Candidatus Dormibacteraeota bacterium]|nr:thioredoxin [Candidatus Dormibacteraeota bacterium]
MVLPDGIVLFVKEDCETCRRVAPVIRRLHEAGVPLTVFTQDDPGFPPGVPAVDDTELRVSWENEVEIVPTLLRVAGGGRQDSVQGWHRARWEEMTGVAGLGPGLGEFGPGCGSRTLDPGMPELLQVRYGGERLRSRRVELAEAEDALEAMEARGWSDGLPLVPPTPARVLRMLEGTSRPPDEVVAVVPPDLVPCTVEKAAVNAVLAGCRPEYLPVVLAALEGACTDEFNAHGLLATTYFAGPMVVVNGPVRERIGMNWGLNALGQGNRANATIGRALQLIVRNVGGGRPAGVDRATMGWPGKVGFCFAEDEAGSPWEPLSVERGLSPDASAVTLFAGGGLQPVVDQISRTPESLARSLAAALGAVNHPKLALGFDAVLVVCPEHARVFAQAGWSKARLREELDRLLTRPGAEMVRGAGGIEEGMPPQFAGGEVPKFRPGGLGIVHAGSTAGMFSAVVPGWVGGPAGSQPVTVEVRP